MVTYREGILICLPQYAGWVMGTHMMSMLALVRDLCENGVPFDIVAGSDSAVHRNRYYLTQTFMNSEWSHMLFIDADIEFTADDVVKLWNMDSDVAVGVYRLKREGSELAAHTGGKLMRIEDLPDEPFEVDYAGTGFMLIRRHVLEELGPTLPRIKTERGEMPRWWSFDVVDGVELPEDYSFCEKVRGLGYKVMMDPSVRLKHWGLKSW